MTQFEVGKSYFMRAVGDHECVWTYTVTKRTASTVTLDDGKETILCKINKKVSEWNKTESVFPLGRYSMAPILRAENVMG